MNINLKIPKLKFGKIDMHSAEEFDKIVDYEKMSKSKTPPKNIKGPYEHTNYKTVKEFFYRAVNLYGENQCILEKPNHKEPYKIKSYNDFYYDVNALGTSLTKLLNLKDKRIVIVGETQYGWYTSYMAILCGAGVAVPIDRELPTNELENLIKRSKASAVIYSPKKKDDIKKIRSRLKKVNYFIEMKSDDKLNGKDVGLEYLIENGKDIIKSGNRDFEKIEIEPEDFKVLIFTSGTTANSKGVMLCNKNLAENINAITAYVKLYPSDMLFSVLPLHHTYESTIGFLYPISQGASVAVCEGLRYIVPNLQEAKPTAILTVPLLVENIYKKINESIKKSHKEKVVSSMIIATNLLKVVGIDIKKKIFKDIYDNLGGNLRIIVSAAAPIDKKVGKWLDDIGMLFIQGYGLTETAPIAAVTPDYKLSIGSAGKTIWQADIKIENPNNEGEGEILIKSPTLMLGYYEDEEETKKAIDTEGYFHSGDIGYLDDDGFVYITGRSKNVIVTQNGKNIYPEEIETLLLKNQEIKDVIVYGKAPEGSTAEKKDKQELIITARVVPNYDIIKNQNKKELSDDEIYDLIWNIIKETNKKLTSYKAIKILEIKKEDFEKTSTMKVKRYKELNQ
ncbi:MAG: AMP-binding protein [Clostridia bacterium]|nr:AMP-binding protein [Clostridia bacterium]